MLNPTIVRSGAIDQYRTTLVSSAEDWKFETPIGTVSEQEGRMGIGGILTYLISQ